MLSDDCGSGSSAKQTEEEIKEGKEAKEAPEANFNVGRAVRELLPPPAEFYQPVPGNRFSLRQTQTATPKSATINLNHSPLMLTDGQQHQRCGSPD